jgi:hypothetical protein
MGTLKISLDNTNAKGVVTILEGQAPIQAQISAVTISGNINAVHAYLLQRMPNKYTSHIEVDKQDGIINLFENQASSERVNVFGKVELNKKLSTFGINKDKKYTPKELIKVLKFNKHLFDSPQEVDKVIEAVGKLSIKVSTTINKTQSNQIGAQSNSFDKNVDAKEQTLQMNCELYSGGEKVKFTVEIWIDVEGQNVQYWFESVSYAELEMSMAESLVDSVLDNICKIENFNLPLIIK